ncbi:MAG: hypothetical protein WDO56_27840 [Gammaproteobacteria bacterium]
MSNQDFTVGSVLICDDIRREANGKAILIGVYVGDIVLNQMPATLPLSLWVQGTAPPGKQEFSIHVYVGEHPDKADPQLNAEPFALQVGPSGEFFLALTGLPMRFPEPTSLTVRFRKGQGEWEVIAKKQIVRQRQSDASDSMVAQNQQQQ